MKASDLYAHLDAILADIRRGKVKSEYRNELRTIVEAWERTYNARAATISVERQKRSDRIRTAVREAAVRVMQERPSLSLRDAAGIVRRRAWASLKESAPTIRCPCTRTVKEELRPYFEKSETSRATNSNHASYALSMTSTSST